MAVAWDVNTGTLEVERTGTTDPQTWTHTPAGTLKGVVVAIVHTTSSTDHVSTVTYGGVSLTRKIRATDTANEPGAAELWFLGSGIPTGAQTVSVDLTSGTTDDMHFVSMGVTGSCDTETVVTGSINENAANPSVTLAYSGRTCLSLAALYGGGATAAAFTKNANCTVVQDFSFGANYSVVLRQTSPGSSDFAIGGTASTDDVAYVALAVSELLFTGTGATAAGGAAASGSGGQTFTGTSAAAGGGAATSGSGTYTPQAITGTGACAVGTVTTAATAAETFTGTGAVAAGGAATSGSGTAESGSTGTGEAAVAGAATSGSGTYVPLAITGTGACAIAGAASLAAAAETFTATGTLTAASAATSGTGMYTPLAITGTGALAVAGASTDGSVSGAYNAGTMCHRKRARVRHRMRRGRG